MEYKVTIKRKWLRRLVKCPEWVEKRFYYLVQDLEEKGPILNHWKNFSPLGKDCYHCHLGYSWVACWKRERNQITIEVYYVGSRENAPY